jgi:lauroyl/myristoyl acyltransferase
MTQMRDTLEASQLSEATTEAARPPRRLGLVRSGRLAPIRIGRLLRSAESVTFSVVIAPLVARLPASLAYRIACCRGDWCFRFRATKRADVVRNLRGALGDELGPDEAKRLAREFFRMISCELIDVIRLRGEARSLGKLVEIRGSEHLDAALAEGKGAILCTAHFGSYRSAFALLNVNGYPVTPIGRSWWNYATDKSSAERWLWDFVFTRRLRRHRHRRSIEPLPGRIQVAARAAVALRANEVVTISSDAPPLGTDRARAVEMPFLGRHVRLLPGVVGLAQLTGAQVLMMFMYRSADYHHQVLEISPPVPMEGETAMAFGRCVAAMDAAVKRRPADWWYWADTEDLCSLGLLPAASPNATGSVSP